MSETYRVLVVGMGKRGLHHAAFFKANPRFELVGVSSRDPERLQNALSKLGNVPSSSNARALALSTKPDVFCFCTPPDVRLGMIKLGLDCGAKLIALEKPVALTSNELFAMRDRIRKAGVKAVVSHQHRYGVHYRKVKEIVASGALGRVHTVLVQRLQSCHLGHGPGRRPVQVQQQSSVPRLHRRLCAIHRRRAWHLRMRRGRARPA
ncbi:MAG: hypothetical protein DME19_10145 [Verrucomicrobia bacterium]|nr:MAG: hypothetical protein DME19_10145 [Verrucomicrobiota bacterium]